MNSRFAKFFANFFYHFWWLFKVKCSALKRYRETLKMIKIWQRKILQNRKENDPPWKILSRPTKTWFCIRTYAKILQQGNTDLIFCLLISPKRFPLIHRVLPSKDYVTVMHWALTNDTVLQKNAQNHCIHVLFISGWSFILHILIVYWNSACGSCMYGQSLYHSNMYLTL